MIAKGVFRVTGERAASSFLFFLFPGSSESREPQNDRRKKAPVPHVWLPLVGGNRLPRDR